MQINIQARSFSLTKALRNHVERRLRFAMGTRDEHIHRVIIRLSDINGTRGGQDKCCHIHLVLPQLPDIIIEDIEVDMYEAIDRAFDRASCTLGRKLARQRDKSRSTGLHELATRAEQDETTAEIY